MVAATAQAALGWEAHLRLEFSSPDAARTTLTRREHSGPLRVQKPLYPEGDRVCQAVIVHPPGGIAGGDRLEIGVAVEADAHALITTPGASKWYKANSRQARQDISLAVAHNAVLEWLPQETIVYNQADAVSTTTIELTGDALYLGWEILCLGRTAAGETFDAGRYRQNFSVRQNDALLWQERGTLEGGSPLLSAASGFAGAPVCATFLAAGKPVTQALLDAARAALAESDPGKHVALTRLPNLLGARYLGPSSEQAKQAWALLWAVLRPALTGRQAVTPRLWHT
jgi:urease accessory protein